MYKAVKRYRAIITLEGSLVIIRRIRADREYYVFPGGGAEPGETPEETLIREGKEELGVVLDPVKLLYRLKTFKDSQFFYLCTVKSGKIGTGNGPEFTSEKYKDSGQYIPVCIPLTDILKYPLMPPIIQQQLINDTKNGKSIFRIRKKQLHDPSVY